MVGIHVDLTQLCICKPRWVNCILFTFRCPEKSRRCWCTSNSCYMDALIFFIYLWPSWPNQNGAHHHFTLESTLTSLAHLGYGKLLDEVPRRRNWKKLFGSNVIVYERFHKISWRLSIILCDNIEVFLSRYTDSRRASNRRSDGDISLASYGESSIWGIFSSREFRKGCLPLSRSVPS